MLILTILSHANKRIKINVYLHKVLQPLCYHELHIRIYLVPYDTKFWREKTLAK